jgi:hypothetical protein
MRPARHLKPGLVAAAAVIVLAGGLITAPTNARVVRNTIDPTAQVTENGRVLVVTGPIQCDVTQPTYLRVTLSQRSTGAVANGIANITCTPDEQQWEVRVRAQGNATFQEGPALATALARSTLNGSPDDAHQWLVDITLVGE